MHNIFYIMIFLYIKVSGGLRKSSCMCPTFFDIAPKICFGKFTDSSNVKQMPVSMHVHHALMDAYHVAQFVEVF